MPIDKFLAESDFVNSSEYVHALQGLEELALKDSADRDSFYRKLSSVLDLFPIRACKYTILTKLSVAVQYGGGSATALEPILKIGARLTEASVFGELVAPIVITLFSSPDHLVRCRLLSTAGQYAKLLPSALVNEKIWSHYVTGFTNKNPDLRELSVRALIHFAPHLSEKIIRDDVLRCISGLQQDREGPIRTNATICLCMIASYIPENLRCKSLINGFGRMLKDPFGPSRVAAVRSILSAANHMTPQSVAELLLPAVCPMCVDPLREVREGALAVLVTMTDKLRAYHEAAPPDPAVASSASGGEVGADPAPASGSSSHGKGDGQGSRDSARSLPARESTSSFVATTPTAPSVSRFADPQPKASPVAPASSGASSSAPSPAAASDGWGAAIGDDDDDDDVLQTQEANSRNATIAKPSSSAPPRPAATATALPDRIAPVAPGPTGGLKLKKKGFGSAKAE
jgi:SCY1-like protein 1